MKKTLLQKAQSSQQQRHIIRGAAPGGEEFELAMAQATGNLGFYQVMYAIGANNRQAAEAWVGRILARAVLYGLLVRR